MAVLLPPVRLPLVALPPAPPCEVEADEPPVAELSLLLVEALSDELSRVMLIGEPVPSASEPVQA